MSPDTPLTDDELGAMLGRSVHARVDDVPTITPSFDGVERRARQITTRRRAAAGLAVGALALFGGLGAAAVFGDDEDGLENDVVTEPDPVDETTVEDPAPDASDEEENGIEEPDVVDDPVLPIGTDDYTLTAVLGDTQFIGVDAAAGTETVLLDVGPAGEQFVDVVMLVDGSILAGVIDGSGLGDETVRHYTSPEAAPVVLSAHGRMNGGAVIDGVPVAFVTDFATEPFGTGSLRVVDLRTYESIVVLEDGSGPESVVVSVDVRGDLLLIEQSSEGGPTWFFRNLDGSTVGLDPLFPGGGPDAVWAFSPRFDRRGDGLLWLELDTATDEWALVSGGLDGIATDRFPLDLGPGAAEAFFTLEVTDGLMVANRTHGVWESSFETTTVWIEPNVVSNGVVLEYGFSREAEAGVVKYIEPPESSDAAGSTVDPEPSEPLADWVDPERLGIVNIESDTNVDDFGPVAAPLVGHDENGTVWAATPGESGTSQADLWQVDGIRAVRYIVDPGDATQRHWLFDLGERVVHVNGDDQARVIADAATLVGGDMRLGRPTAYVADLPIAAGGAVEIGDIHLIDLLTGDSITLFAGVSTNDSVVREVVLGGGVTFVELGGVGVSTLLGVESAAIAPTGFGGADAATLSADGTTLFWMNQVDVDGDLRPVVDLTVADVATGVTETSTVVLPATQVALDYDLQAMGDQLLLIRSWPGGFDNGRQTTSYAAPLALDPTTGTVTELGLEPGAWTVVGS